MRVRDSGAAEYDAFISYSHAVSGKLAATLQSWLERFATPWYRPRSLRIFRDYTSLSASEDLRRTIERALSVSSWFILLASPEAAHSKWVGREVEWWRLNRPASRMCIVLTGGELCWSDARGDWDWKLTTALPQTARGMFERQPLWVDMSSVRTSAELDRSNPMLLDSVAQVAAPLRGVDKDLLVGEHIRQHRRARRQRRGGIGALAVLTAAAVTAAFLAVVQAKKATDQARVSTARALASAAVANLGTHLDLAQVLAVRAYRMSPDLESRSALFQAVTSEPALVRYLSAGSAVTKVAGSGNRQVIVAGTQDGRVVRWTGDGLKRLVIAHLRGKITSLSVSHDGSTVAAADQSSAIVWTAKAGMRTMTLPRGQTPLIAVSPSGRFVAADSSGYLPHKFAVSGRLTLLDTTSSRQVGVSDNQLWTGMVMPSEHEVVLFNGGYGSWERRVTPTLTRVGGGSVEFGIHDYAAAISPDGTLITYTNGATTLPLWRTREPTPFVDHPDLQAASAGPIPSALAISPDHRKAATADNGSIYVGGITKAGTRSESPVKLTGNSTINPDSLTFFGDASHLLSASGSLVTLWHLSQLGRIATVISTTVPASCSACSESWLSVSPGDKNVAIVAQSGEATIIQPLHPRSSAQELNSSDILTYGYGPVAWRGSGDVFLLPATTGLQLRRASPGLPLLARWPQTKPATFVKAISISGDGKRIVIVDATNTVEVADGARGKIIKTLRGPADPDASVSPPNVGTAAVNSDGTAVAVVTPQQGVSLIDIETGKVSKISISDATGVQFGGRYLAIKQSNGNLGLWSVRTRRLTATLLGDSSTLTSFALNDRGTLLAQYRSDDTVLLRDIPNGDTVGSLNVSSPFAGLKQAMVFSHDGAALFIATEGTGGINSTGQLETWNLSANDWIRTACETAGRDLTREEWRKYVGTAPPSSLTCMR